MEFILMIIFKKSTFIFQQSQIQIILGRKSISSVGRLLIVVVGSIEFVRLVIRVIQWWLVIGLIIRLIVGGLELVVGVLNGVIVVRRGLIEWVIRLIEVVGLVPSHVLLLIDSCDLGSAGNSHLILLSSPCNTKADNENEEENAKYNGANYPIRSKLFIIVVVARVRVRTCRAVVRTVAIIVTAILGTIIINARTTHLFSQIFIYLFYHLIHLIFNYLLPQHTQSVFSFMMQVEAQKHGYGNMG